MTYKSDLQNELSAWNRRLQLLKEKKAKLGNFADPSVDIEIEEIEVKLAVLHSDWKQVNDSDLLHSSAEDSLLREQQYQVACQWAANGRKENLSRFNLSHTDLRAVDFIRVNLSLANLNGADLRRANLTKADLRMADLSLANLQEAQLVSGVDLTEANLTNANLSNANLTGADLTKANLIGANFDGANLFTANLKEIIYDNTTVWPKYFRLRRVIPSMLGGFVLGIIVGMIAGIFLGIAFGPFETSGPLIVIFLCGGFLGTIVGAIAGYRFPPPIQR